MFTMPCVEKMDSRVSTKCLSSMPESSEIEKNLSAPTALTGSFILTDSLVPTISLSTICHTGIQRITLSFLITLLTYIFLFK